jgi:hypothetical protein
MTYNRRVKRLPAGWDGVCRIEGEPGEWSCRVDDISMLGLGITLMHASPAQLAGRRIAVDVPAVAQLEGEITHAEPILGGAVHIGVVFSEGPSPRAAAAPQSAMGERSGS